MKVEAIVMRLFVISLSYLSYKGWINVIWMEMENATKIYINKCGMTSRTSVKEYSIVICNTFKYNRGSRFTGRSCIWIHHYLMED
jgi:uncharacterized membrane protein (Fun14 family)